jgi:hypothetical protein
VSCTLSYTNIQNALNGLFFCGIRIHAFTIHHTCQRRLGLLVLIYSE